MAGKDPINWLHDWGNIVVYVSVAVLTSIGTVSAWLWNVLRRLDNTESLAGRVDESLTKLQGDLSQHEDEDYYEFSKIHSRMDKLTGPVERVDEATEWIKGALKTLTESVKTMQDDRTYAHERIAEHDRRNRAAAAKYEKEVLAIIEGKERRILELEQKLANVSTDSSNI